MKPFLMICGILWASTCVANNNVYVSRFWHNHQPIYWPEWNGNGSENNRVQFAWDSIVLKPSQDYSSGANHPENDLVQIFGIDDRKNAYQSGPRNSLAGLNSSAGFAMSYSGSLMDNVRNLGRNNQLGYGSGWWDGNREASGWQTPGGSPRLDLLGFTYHHSLGAVLPKAVLRKEIQVFKQGWWKAWGKNPDLSDHSKGFFPTEMAFSRHMVDVLADEGFEWVLVASHHLSRTCPTYFDQFDLDNNQYGIFSSPPNKSDLLGPSPTSGWWYSEPNPGNAAWNVSPHAYQLHKAKYVNPETGAEKTIVMVPSDDVLSYRYGYANEGVGKINDFISPHATDPNRPVIVMPSTDGDNAWGGGSSSWFEATPQLFNEGAANGYNMTSPQDFVNAHGANAPVAHVEDGAWIFPESDYGSPYFLKWVEPPIVTTTATNAYPGTLVDMETPGFALKFFAWAPVISGANWCETAEQIFTGEGGTVEAWKIQAPYDWDVNNTYSNPNVVERAWHIYLAGLDSGFNYYGGLGNDDEIKSSLATRRAVEMLSTYMSTRLHLDATPPTVFKPQRFPYNPGGYTFGWFNSIPNNDDRYLKKMPSEFYIWTHAYDVSGVSNVTLKVRVDNDGVNPLSNNQNETFAGGGEVGNWVSIPMTKRVLPNTESALNAAANNGQINYFSAGLSPEIADYYFARIDESALPGFKGKLIDYYIEAVDTLSNTHKSDIQHVFVEDDGLVSGPRPSEVNWTPASPNRCEGATLDISYTAYDGVLSNAAPIYLSYAYNGATNFSDAAMTQTNGQWMYTLPIATNVTSAAFAFNDGAGIWDNNGGGNWNIAVGPCPTPSTAFISPLNPTGCVEVTVYYNPGTDLLSSATNITAHLGFNDFDTVQPQAMVFSNGQWQTTITLTPGVNEINAAFRDGSTWDNNKGSDWNWSATGCVGPYNPAVCAIEATPIVSNDPAIGADQNNVGDNFDLDELGGAAQTYAQGGFGNFGNVYVNVDANALYIGGYDLQPQGSNNAMVVFLGLNTLTNDVSNLWNLNGSPQALDLLHNVAFTETMDVAILIGDEYGDGIYTNFTVGSGYDHGQGIFVLEAPNFVPATNAILSQFDGTTNSATLSADDDLGDRQTDRWEARIPWATLGATTAEEVTELNLVGLILSDSVNGLDRYLSGNYLGEQVTAVEELDIYNNYGTSFITLSPVGVCLPHIDGDGDGLRNGYELRYFGGAGVADATADDDLDGHNNLEEQMLGTSPDDENSALFISSISTNNTVEWQSVGGRNYRVEYNDSSDMSPAQWFLLGEQLEDDVANGVPATEAMMDPNPAPDRRVYRISVKP